MSKAPDALSAPGLFHAFSPGNRHEETGLLLPYGGVGGGMSCAEDPRLRVGDKWRSPDGRVFVIRHYDVGFAKLNCGNDPQWAWFRTEAEAAELGWTRVLGPTWWQMLLEDDNALGVEGDMPTCDHGNKGYCGWCDGPRKPAMAKTAKLPYDPRDVSGEATRTAEQIHASWPFIPAQEAREFYLSLLGVSAAEGSVRVSLWVLARVIEHNAKR